MPGGSAGMGPAEASATPESPAPARRHLLALPPRKPDHLTAHLGPESHAPPLWALAKVFGVRPHYDHWDSRIRGTG